MGSKLSCEGVMLVPMEKREAQLRVIKVSQALVSSKALSC